MNLKKDWLLNIPDKDLYKEFWEEISDVYGGLVDDKWTLDDKLDCKSNLIKWYGKNRYLV